MPVRASCWYSGDDMIANKIKAWLRGDDARAAFHADVTSLARDAGTRFARGNIAVQFGAFQTRADLDRARELARRRVEKDVRKRA